MSIGKKIDKRNALYYNKKQNTEGREALGNCAGRSDMKKLLVTGCTVFVSKFVTSYFLQEPAYEVYVLNRNTRPQLPDVHLIQADRHDLGEKFKTRSRGKIIWNLLIGIWYKE